MLLLSPVLAVAGTLDDMELRSNVEASIRGTALTAGLQLKIRVEKRIAFPEGRVRDLNQIDDVADLAAKVKGIEGVGRSGLVLEFAGPADAELASRVARTLFESPRYNASSIAIAVEHGVVTLTGAITNASWRGELRKICGAISGVVDLVDRLVSPETPDARIQKALDGVFGVRVVSHFPGRVLAVVRDGTVTLDGNVPNLYDRQLAEKGALRINGVHRVDNHLEFASGRSVQVIHP